MTVIHTRQEVLQFGMIPFLSKDGDSGLLHNVCTNLQNYILSAQKPINPLIHFHIHTVYLCAY